MLEDDGLCGQTAMTVTPQNVSRTESLINRDPKMTYTEIQDIIEISSGGLSTILHDCLSVRKRCACWVLHELSEKQKQGKVDWCTLMP